MTQTTEWAAAKDLVIRVAQPFDIQDAYGTSNTTVAIELDNGSSSYVIQGDVRALRRLALRLLAHTAATPDETNQYAKLHEILAAAREAGEDEASAVLAQLVRAIDQDDSL
ncbi:hypothetical protein PYV02_14680 [Leifsonia sp. H3M29-4]|jgi:malonyl CoA-acyl carrier protein transacylase|uniref:hypothetical protein n=1 Tax=Salinibacterium metalliresistens TaxID=3031321 RepID=UPI0023DC36EC|nr:hypothetical protein [Salinibacterium metalliresistens]MDF1480328.1 hypothetical protein [Salinibacterium metalliresistens]